MTMEVLASLHFHCCACYINYCIIELELYYIVLQSMQTYFIILYIILFQLLLLPIINSIHYCVHTYILITLHTRKLPKHVGGIVTENIRINITEIHAGTLLQHRNFFFNISQYNFTIYNYYYPSWRL